ncbi:FimB/Mfa2 family fimbrial subunit [Porphyromonadaceae bacterium W3.11]|nr:FimB/Mfa2 family fimbrial subunit [Porphyromonadaceae bacterium W3.11]
MKFNNFKFTVAALAVLMILLTAGCRDSFFDRHSEPTLEQKSEDDDEEMTITDGISITLDYESHSLKTPMLRTALTAIDVNKESELRLNGTRILVFDNNENYLYDAPVIKIEPNISAPYKGKITLLAKEGQGLTLVLLSNLTKEEKVRIVSGKKSDVLKSFKFGITKDTDFAEGGLPMWGELNQLTISQDQGAQPNIGKINLLRAVARVDVGLNMTAKGNTGTDADFDETSQTLQSTIIDPQSKKEMTVKWGIDEVYFFNAATKGLVAPTSGKYALEDGKAKAKEVSLPSDPGKQDITYTAHNNLLKRVIYVPESDNPEPSASNGAQTLPGDQANYMNRPYLVVKLNYTEVGSNAKGVTYFRIDFLKKEGDEATAKYTYLPLLRNHRYKVDIKNIGGLGFEKLEDAKKGPSANIMYNVLVWDESQMSNVVYDGQYMLGVKTDEFTFYKAKGGTVSTTVQTSWPDGFEVKNLPDWVKVKSIESTGSDTSETSEKLVTFEVIEDTNQVREWLNSDDHEGTYIQAGRMRWNLSFKQLNTLDVKIEIFSDKECIKPLQFIELDERGEATPNNPYTVGKKKFYVRVNSGSVISDVANNTGDHFLFSSGTASGQELPPLAQAKEISANVFEFEVTASPMNNEEDHFELKQNKYIFTATQGGESAQAELTINQTEYNIVFYEDEALTSPITNESGIYLMDGEKHRFYVKSNIPYTLWLDNQIIDEAARTSVNSDDKGNAKLPMVVSYFEEGAEKNINYVIGQWIKVKEQLSTSRLGSPLDFRVANDINNPKIIYGHVKWVAGTPLPSVAWKFPMFTGNNKDEVTMIISDFVSATFLPEANSYPITLGKSGVLIPLSRINKAASFYDLNFDSPEHFTDSKYSDSSDQTAKLNSSETWESYKRRNKLNILEEDDKISLEVLWTDVKSVTEAGSTKERNPIQKDGTAPLKLLTTIKTGGEQYAFLLPGKDEDNNYGNLVFGVRSSIKDRVDNKRSYSLDPAEEGKKALLWSFHIMLYRSSQIPADNGSKTNPDNNSLTYYDRSIISDYETVWGLDVVSWPYDLGAFELPIDWKTLSDNGLRYQDFNYRRVGLTYQFGRKDPFPRWINAVNAPTRIVGHDGKEVKFTLRKGVTISMRESIENPMVMAASVGGHQWLTEGGNTLDTNIGLGGSSSFGYYGLWGGGPAVGNESTAGQRRDIMRTTIKTVFDPCPYGFAVPTPGYSFTRVFENESNMVRFKPNFVVWAKAGSIKVYNTYSGDETSLFSIYTGNGVSGTGEGFWAVSTTYLAQAHYPVILLRFGTNRTNERYQADVHRSSPIMVRPFTNRREADWNKYITR